MKFRKHFIAAQKHLESIGLNPTMREGEPISSINLRQFEKDLGTPLPPELQEYLLEMGDAFTFSCESIPCEGMPPHKRLDYSFTWIIPPINELLSCWSCIHDEATSISRGEDDYVSDQSEECRQEACRRVQWLPIENLDGSYICLDMAFNPSPVRYHDKYWAVGMEADEAKSIVLASSLYEFVRCWSRFCYSQPLIDGQHLELGSYVSGRDGVFDWSPTHFAPQFDRGSADA